MRLNQKQQKLNEQLVEVRPNIVFRLVLIHPFENPFLKNLVS